MASQETHTSIENHASSPIPSNEAEEEEDPAQLVAHITPKSPAQIVSMSMSSLSIMMTLDVVLTCDDDF